MCFPKKKKELEQKEKKSIPLRWKKKASENTSGKGLIEE